LECHFCLMDLKGNRTGRKRGQGPIVRPDRRPSASVPEPAQGARRPRTSKFAFGEFVRRFPYGLPTKVALLLGVPFLFDGSEGESNLYFHSLSSRPLSRNLILLSSRKSRQRLSGTQKQKRLGLSSGSRIDLALLGLPG